MGKRSTELLNTDSGSVFQFHNKENLYSSLILFYYLKIHNKKITNNIIYNKEPIMKTITEKHLFNFKIPLPLKTKFQQKCTENYSSMSRELIELIKEYISD